MELQWYGHACFGLTNAQGFTVVTDPPAPSVGYPLSKVSANFVTISHEHSDHNYYQAIGGSPKVAHRPGTVAPAELPPGIAIRGVASFHDEVGGKKRGANVIFVFELDGLRVVHLGDLGHQLTPQHLAELGAVDVLLVPVGGVYTIAAQGAYEVCQAVQPRLAIPMHYKTPAIQLSLAPVDEFLKLCPKVEHPNRTSLALAPGELKKLSPWQAVVLNYR